MVSDVLPDTDLAFYAARTSLIFVCYFKQMLMRNSYLSGYSVQDKICE